MSAQENFNRRRLLEKATGIAVGAIAFPHIVPSLALGKADSTAASNRIVMGCIGMGGQGTANMRAFMGHSDVRVVAVCDDVRVVAVCDVRAERRQKAKDIVDGQYGDKGCATYNDFRELLARKDIDAVMIAPPDHWHALMAVAAARTGKDMYCEKPLGVAVLEGQAMRDAVRRYSRVFQTGTQQRSDRKFRWTASSGLPASLH
jgi:predicted dehydrogenase